MAPLARVDALVLGCTHYSAGMARFRELAPAAVIVDPARETLDRVVSGGFGRRARADSPDDSRDPVVATDTFFTTGDPAATARAALLAFGVTMPLVVGVGADLRGLG
jgi:glutamate racemase